MKRSRLFAIGVAFALTSTLGSDDANAWFFFFIPGQVIDKIGDKLSGAQGDNCVAATAKVGDVITSPAGNTATIKSLSGSWSRCQQPNLPIRALLEFNYSFSSKAGIDLAEGFKPRELNATQRYNGILLSVIDDHRTIGLVIFARPRKPGADGAALAHTVSASIINVIEDGKTSNAEEIRINGMRAYRFQVVGKNKGVFGRSFTYLVTVLEGEVEYVVLNANCRTDDFEQYKEVLKQFAYEVKGITNDQQGTLISTAGEGPSVQPASQAPNVPPTGVMAKELADDGLSVKKSDEESKSTNPPPVSAPAANAPGDALADKLRLLDKLRKEGLISEKDYEAKKQELLKSL
jgi:hypothetical protein